MPANCIGTLSDTLKAEGASAAADEARFATGSISLVLALMGACTHDVRRCTDGASLLARLSRVSIHTASGLATGRQQAGRKPPATKSGLLARPTPAMSFRLAFGGLSSRLVFASQRVALVDGCIPVYCQSRMAFRHQGLNARGRADAIQQYARACTLFFVCFTAVSPGPRPPFKTSTTTNEPWTERELLGA